MTLKITMFFERGKFGWTENYFKAGADPVAATDLTVANRATICRFRHQSTKLTAVRASVLGAPRTGFLRPFQEPGQTSGNEGPEAATVDALILLWGTAPRVARRHVWVRGLDDDTVARSNLNGAPAPVPELKNALDNFINYLKTNGYLIRALNTAVAPNNWIPILKFAPHDGAAQAAMRVYPVDPAVLPVLPATIYFRNVNQIDMPGLRGNFVVLERNVAGGYFTIPYRYKRQEESYTPINAYYRNAGYQEITITDGVFQDFTSRDTGRPTNSPRGRKRGVSLRK